MRSRIIFLHFLYILKTLDIKKIAVKRKRIERKPRESDNFQTPNMTKRSEVTLSLNSKFFYVFLLIAQLTDEKESIGAD